MGERSTVQGMGIEGGRATAGVGGRVKNQGFRYGGCKQLAGKNPARNGKGRTSKGGVFLSKGARQRLIARGMLGKGGGGNRWGAGAIFSGG